MKVKDMILCLLLDGPLSGYDIKKKYEMTFTDYIDVALNNIYTALIDLDDAGFLECERVDQNSRPNKKLYNLTALGRRTAISALLHVEPRQQITSDFLFIISFASHMPQTRVKQLINQRLNQLSKMLVRQSVRFSSDERTPYEIFVEGMIDAAIKAEIEYLVTRRDDLLESKKGNKTRAFLNKEEILEAATVKGKRLLKQ
ncbi:MAG: hypothetical protein GC184_01285 [Rhizobiales bacterium]|nr:hypothetical protein [Hyphomicrobiales bacterium]